MALVLSYILTDNVDFFAQCHKCVYTHNKIQVPIYTRSQFNLCGKILPQIRLTFEPRFFFSFYDSLFLNSLVSNLPVELLTVLGCQKPIPALLHPGCRLDPHQSDTLKIFLWVEGAELLAKPASWFS